MLIKLFISITTSLVHLKRSLLSNLLYMCVGIVLAALRGEVWGLAFFIYLIF